MYDVRYIFYLTFLMLLVQVKCPCLSSIQEACAVIKVGINKGSVGGDERKSEINK